MRALFFAILLLFAWCGNALAWAPPPIKTAVVDSAHKLSDPERQALERDLAAYRKQTTNEVVVFLPASLEGRTIEDVAYDAFNQWGVGKKGKDNGVLLVIAPAEHRMRIETGKGVGDRLTDIESSHILRDRVGPLLKQERYSDAASAGTQAIEAALDGRPAPPLPSANAMPARPPQLPLACVYDPSGRLPIDDVAAVNERCKSDPRWRKLALVFLDREVEYADVNIDTANKTVVIVGIRDLNVGIFGDDNAREAIAKIVRAAPVVDLSLVDPIAECVFHPVPPAPPKKAEWSSFQWTAAAFATGLVACFLGLFVWLSRKGTGAPSSSRSSDVSPSSYDGPSYHDNPSVTTYSPPTDFGGGNSFGGGGGGGTDYTPGGGSSGGGGASGSW